MVPRNHHIEALTTRVDDLAARAANLHWQENHTHKKALDDIQFELRVLAVKLRLYHEDDLDTLSNWCSNRWTLRRMALMQNVLQDMEAEHNIKLIRKINSFVTSAKYQQDFVDYLGLKVFFKEQRKEQARHMSRLRTAMDISRNGFWFLGSLGSLIQRTMRTIGEVTTSLGMFAQAVPIISGLWMVLPVGIHAVRSWIDKKDAANIVISTILATLALAALALSIVFPVAAAGIGAVLVTIGIIVDSVKPYFEIRSEIAALRREINVIDDRTMELGINKEHAELHEREKKYLLKILMHYAMQHKDLHLDDLSQEREKIARGSIKELQNSVLIRAAVQTKTNKPLYEFIIDCNQEHIENLHAQIAAKEKIQRGKTRDNINGIFSIIGTIMIAIPFPPVQIAGAVILVASSFVGISMRYNLHGRLWNAIKNGCKKLFTPKPKIEVMPLEEEPLLELSNNAKLYQQINGHNPDDWVILDAETSSEEFGVSAEEPKLQLPPIVQDQEAAFSLRSPLIVR